jgi:hypothetical protein
VGTSVDQTGGAAVTQTTDIVQTGAGNDTKIIQDNTDFTDAKVTVLQDGTDNTLDLNQSAPGIGQLTAAVEQIGDGNLATISQIPNFSSQFAISVRQEGTGNQTDILQQSGQGGNGDIAVEQFGTGNKSTSNQWGGEQAQSMHIMQNGADNTADVFQYTLGVPTDATVTQTGDGNSASIHQEVFYGSPSVSASIEQTGDDNQASIEQRPPYTLLAADIIQTGNSNQGTILQEGGSFLIGNGSSIANIEQTDGNDAFISQSGNGDFNNLGDPALTASLKQTGNGNVASIVQDGFGASQLTGELEQNGDDNLLELTQTTTSASSFTFSMTQNGSNNSMIVHQGP